MSIEFLNTDFEKVSYLASILTARATGGEALNEEYEALRYELLSNNNISPLLPDWLKIHRNLDSFWGFIQPKFGSYSDRRKFLADEFSPVLNLLEFGHTVEVQNKSEAQPKPASQKTDEPQPVKKKVFLVHGRDNEAKQEVARYVESFGLEVIILHEQASSGMTIIEKIEHYANDADFAIVLYTACDHGRGINESKVHPKNRARQNVVFEHGYLMAKLGRKNVCALVKGEIETPNDISGVVYVGLDAAGAWKTEITKELNARGYNVVSFF
jgi:predicted nucleotide-binding protein